jgi:hypothetical protein
MVGFLESHVSKPPDIGHPCILGGGQMWATRPAVQPTRHRVARFEITRIQETWPVQQGKSVYLAA